MTSIETTPATTTSPAAIAVENATVVTPPAPAPPEVAKTPMGQGTPLPTGGRWIGIKSIGRKTAVLSYLVSALSCMVILFPCGIWILICCPCDEIRAYEVNGQVYNESGQHLGEISKFKRYRIL